MKDEKLVWFLVGGLFLFVLAGVDIFYSSWNIMKHDTYWLFILIGILHLLLVVLWIAVLIKFTDPNYDHLRKDTVYLTAALIIIVAIHHATQNEDQQVLIDSHENKIKDSIQDAHSIHRRWDSAHIISTEHRIDTVK